MEKVQVTVCLSQLIAHATGGKTRMYFKAATLKDCLGQLQQAHPLMKVHLFEEDGRQRPHVLIYYGKQDIRWLPNLDIPLEPDSEITILQAVSGG